MSRLREQARDAEALSDEGFLGLKGQKEERKNDLLESRESWALATCPAGAVTTEASSYHQSCVTENREGRMRKK